MLQFNIWSILIILALIYFIIQYYNMRNTLEEAKNRVNNYNVKNIKLSYGNMTYVDNGEGEVILSIHGIFGGYDQAYNYFRRYSSKHRLICPSRFGYLNSDTYDDNSLKKQIEAYIELLDKLNIDKVTLFCISAGGTIGLNFALMYPHRVKSIIFYSSLLPPKKKPLIYIPYQAPPKFLILNYFLYCFKPLLWPVAKMPNERMIDAMPFNWRKKGIIIDGKITNPDTQRNFDFYKLENINMPSLFIHSKDDRIIRYNRVKYSIDRIKNKDVLITKSGGHLHINHDDKVRKKIEDFIQEQKKDSN